MLPKFDQSVFAIWNTQSAFKKKELKISDYKKLHTIFHSKWVVYKY